MNNDEDIKIYIKNSSSDISEFDCLIKNIDFNRSNGNEEKAKKLGIFFAGLKPTDEGLNIVVPKQELTSSVLYQSRVLITFLCGRFTKEEINNQFISDTVRNSMYDSLKETEPGYYNNIADGAAFSFYRTAFKKDGDVKENIGREFAKLCGISKSEKLAELGESIYLNTKNYVVSLIDKCDFQY